MLSTVSVPRPVHFSQPETSLGRTDSGCVGDRFRVTRKACPHSFEREGAHDRRIQGQGLYIPDDADPFSCWSLRRRKWWWGGRGAEMKRRFASEDEAKTCLIEGLSIVQSQRMDDRRHGLLVLRGRRKFVGGGAGRAGSGVAPREGEVRASMAEKRWQADRRATGSRHTRRMDDGYTIMKGWRRGGSVEVQVEGFWP